MSLEIPSHLVRGKGDPDSGGCWMSELSRCAGEQWSDHPECVCPLINPYCRHLSDWVAEEDRDRVIRPHFFTPMNTRTNDPVVLSRRVSIIARTFRQHVRLDDLGEVAAQAAMLDRIAKSDMRLAMGNYRQFTLTQVGHALYLAVLYHNGRLEDYLLPTILQMCDVSATVSPPQASSCEPESLSSVAS